MSEKSQNTEAILFAALEKPVEEQASFLEEACGGDPKLRQRLQKMLSAAPQIGDFLEKPYSDQGTDVHSEPSREGPGTQIGPYKWIAHSPRMSSKVAMAGQVALAETAVMLPKQPVALSTFIHGRQVRRILSK